MLACANDDALKADVGHDCVSGLAIDRETPVFVRSHAHHQERAALRLDVDRCPVRGLHDIFHDAVRRNKGRRLDERHAAAEALAAEHRYEILPVANRHHLIGEVVTRPVHRRDELHGLGDLEVVLRPRLLLVEAPIGRAVPGVGHRHERLPPVPTAGALDVPDGIGEVDCGKERGLVVVALDHCPDFRSGGRHRKEPVPHDPVNGVASGEKLSGDLLAAVPVDFVKHAKVGAILRQRRRKLRWIEKASRHARIQFLGRVDQVRCDQSAAGDHPDAAPAQTCGGEDGNGQPAAHCGDDPVGPRQIHHHVRASVLRHAPDVHERPRVEGRERADRQRCGDGGGRCCESQRGLADDLIAGEHAVEHLRRENDRREDPHHRELLRIADGRRDSRSVQPFEQGSVIAECENRGGARDDQHQPPAARPNERSSDAERDRQHAHVDAEEKRRAHSGIEAAAPVPHHPMDRDVAEDVGIDQLRELRPRHAPRTDEIEAEHSRARRVVHMIERGKHLRRADRYGAQRDQSNPRDGRCRLEHAPLCVPPAIQPVAAEEQAGLHHRRRFADQELQAEEKRGRGEVANRRTKKKSPHVQTCERQPRRAEQNRQQIHLGQIHAAQSPRHRAEPRCEWPQLHRSQHRVHAEDADVDVNEDVQPVAEIVARQQDEPG